MNADELMIGNYVQCFDVESDVWCVDSAHRISIDRCLVTKDEIEGNAPANGVIKFIPLTEQWLLDFGFVSNAYADCYDKEIKIECDKTKGRLDLWCSNITGRIIYLKHVHQLQNLYFALTGNKLEKV